MHCWRPLSCCVQDILTTSSRFVGKRFLGGNDDGAIRFTAWLHSYIAGNRARRIEFNRLALALSKDEWW